MAAVLAHAYLGDLLGVRGKLGIAIAFAGVVPIAHPELSSSVGASSALGLVIRYHRGTVNA